METHQHAKFSQNWSVGCEGINIFQFFKMAGDAILDFQMCEISLADSVWKAQTHYRAKWRQNWSSVVKALQFFEFSKWQIKIFSVVQDGGCRHLGLSNYWLTVSGGPRRIILPDFIKIGHPLRRYSILQILKAAAILDF